MGGGHAARLFLLLFFPCSADHERDWQPCKVVFRVGNQYPECEKQQPHIVAPKRTVAQHLSFIRNNIIASSSSSLLIEREKNHRFSVCDSNIWIGVNPRVVVAPFARRHLWCICAAVSVGSQCVVARFARRHLWCICAAVSVESQCVAARFARRHLWVFVPR